MLLRCTSPQLPSVHFSSVQFTVHFTFLLGFHFTFLSLFHFSPFTFHRPLSLHRLADPSTRPSRIWDPLTRQCLRTLVHEDNPAVTSVCFSPNGRFVLAWSQDACVRLWDYVAGSVKKTYQGHGNGRFAIGGCFGVLPRQRAAAAGGGLLEEEEEEQRDAADAARQRERAADRHGGEYPFVASASEDGDVVLWDVRTKAVVQRVRGHDGVCFWVDVHGDTMASGGQDRVVRVYRHRRPGERAAPGGQGRGSQQRDGVGEERAQLPVGAANGVNGHGAAAADPVVKGETPQQEDQMAPLSALPLRQEELKAEEQ
jgi:COMPASS component SWD3